MTIPSLPAGWLEGRYRLDAPVARGGMATVYRGYDTKLDRVVAIKIMHPDLAALDDFTRLFQREARAVAALS
ncbi:serine/threonine protein kinase, partial [Actinotignum timonense]|nr:serine/threonine protein kinase [Actinotignum timonense]